MRETANDARERTKSLRRAVMNRTIYMKDLNVRILLANSQ